MTGKTSKMTGDGLLPAAGFAIPGGFSSRIIRPQEYGMCHTGLHCPPPCITRPGGTLGLDDPVAVITEWAEETPAPDEPHHRRQKGHGLL